MEVELTFDLERETKRTLVYVERPTEGVTATVGSLYIRKDFLGAKEPKQIRITINVDV